MRNWTTRRVRYTDFDAAADALNGSLTAASPLRGGPFLLEAVSIGLDDVVVQVGRNSPLLVQGALPADAIWAAFPVSRTGPVLINGRAAGPHAVALYGAGALHDAASHGEAGWALVALRAASAERLLEPPRGSPLRRPGRCALLDCDQETWRRAVLCLRSAAEVATQDPEVFEVAEARRSLRSEVIEVSRDLLTGGRGGRPSRLQRSPSDRQRMVRAVEDYLRAHPWHAPTAADVAAALGVSAPRLGRAIRATFGISLARYLLVRRLTRFREALRAAGPGRRSPREIALAHGFWRLDRLAKDYGELFGEALDGRFGRD